MKKTPASSCNRKSGTRHNMNVIFDQKDALNGTISISITSADYLPAYEKKLKDYGKKANIPGFRAGHAPKSMIEKMVGNNLLLEEINSVASNALFNYIDEQKLNVLGQPVLTEDTKVDALTKDSDYTFRFDIGIAPQVELNIGKGDVFTKYKTIVPDTAVDEEIERMRKRFGNLSDADSVEENDMIYVALTETDENGAAMEGGVSNESVPVAVNTIKAEDIKSNLVGKGKGFETKVNLFALFNNDESEIGHALGIQKQTVADLNPEFLLTIKEIKRTQESELNTEFFDKIFGEGNVSDEQQFREKIREEISFYYDQQAQHLLEHEMFDTLVEKHAIQLPDEFLKRWLMDRHPDKFNAENVDHAYLPEANYLRNHLLEEKILLTNGIKIDDAEIRQAGVDYTRQMFSSYGNHGLGEDFIMSIVEPQLQKEEFRSRMINIAARKKVNNWLLENITIEPKEVTVEEFTSIMEQHNHKHHHNHDHDHDHE